VDIDTVGIDNFGGIMMLTRHLYELGHRKIGFVGRCAEIQWSSTRFGAYVSALTALGLEYRPERVIEIDADQLTHSQLGGDQYCEQVGRQIEQGVRAWICVAEPVGWRLHAWLNARGIRVPQEVSLTGFHRPDSNSAADLASNFEASLTSVTASYEAIGAAALQRLLYRIQNPSEATRTILFPCELHSGRSVASPVCDNFHTTLTTS
jgi:DNA-binding LacI/PurR family transcriptional regulator